MPRRKNRNGDDAWGFADGGTSARGMAEQDYACAHDGGKHGADGLGCSAQRMFAELSAGGKVQMPLQQTFWAVKFGMLVDRFGIPWMINCE